MLRSVPRYRGRSLRDLALHHAWRPRGKRCAERGRGARRSERQSRAHDGTQRLCGARTQARQQQRGAAAAADGAPGAAQTHEQAQEGARRWQICADRVDARRRSDASQRSTHELLLLRALEVSCVGVHDNRDGKCVPRQPLRRAALRCRALYTARAPSGTARRLAAREEHTARRRADTAAHGTLRLQPATDENGPRRRCGCTAGG